MSRIGLTNFHYAPLLTDTAEGATYGPPVAVPGIITASVNPASSSATLYADNAPAEVGNTLGEITVEIALKDLPIEHQAALLGHTVVAGVMTSAGTDVAPYVAIMFEGLKASGKKKFVKLLKGMFNVPNDTYETKKESINFQTDKITGKFVVREFDSKWKLTAEEDATGYLPATGSAWYTSVENQA